MKKGGNILVLDSKSEFLNPGRENVWLLIEFFGVN
jgi:hypothetical protein